MKREDIVFFVICTLFLLGSVGIVMFESGSRLWLISGFIAPISLFSMLGALAVKIITLLRD